MKKGLSFQVKLIVLLLLCVIIPVGTIALLADKNSSSALEKAAFKELEAVTAIEKDAINNYFEGIESDLNGTLNSTTSFLEFSYDQLSSINDLKNEAVKRFFAEEDKNMLLNPTTGVFNALNKIVGTKSGLGKTGESYIVEKVNGRIKLVTNLTTMGDGKYITGYEITDIATDYIIQVLNGISDNGIFLDSSSVPSLVSYRPLNLPGVNWALVTKMNLEEILIKDFDGKDFYNHYGDLFKFNDIFLIHPNGFIYYSVKKKPDYQTNILNGVYKNSGLGKITEQVIATNKFSFTDFEPYSPSNEEPAAFIAVPVIISNKIQIIIAFQLSPEGINSVMQNSDGMGDTGGSYLIGSDYLMRSDSSLDHINLTVAESFENPSLGSVKSDTVKKALDGNTGREIIIDKDGNPVLSAYAPIDIQGTRWSLIAEIDASEAFASVYQLRNIIYIISTLVIFIVGLIGFFFSRSIAKPLNAVSSSLNSSSLQIASAAGELSNTSQDLANGASEQASSIEETTASMEELGAMVRQNVENAKQMSILAQKSSHSSETGNKQMDELLESMEDLSSSSSQIKKIIKVIDSIAFQTNILALNAAVEAARAGEAGLGFAVVADEVKNLANKSANAAQETSDLIEDSLKKIDQGLSVTRGLSIVFREILMQGQKVTEMSREVETASTQQDIGIGQINEVVVQLDKVVQSNASAAEESASSAEELSAQSETLRTIVQQLVKTITGKVDVQNIVNDAYLALPATKKKQETRVQVYSGNNKNSEIRPEDLIPFEEDEEFTSL